MIEELVKTISDKCRLKEEVVYCIVSDIEERGKLQELHDHVSLLTDIYDILLEIYENFLD